LGKPITQPVRDSCRRAPAAADATRYAFRCLLAAQERLAYCREASVPLLATDELDHLLALPGVRHVPVVNAGDFEYAKTWEPMLFDAVDDVTGPAAALDDEPQAFGALRAHEVVIVVRSAVHYVVVRIWRERAYGIRARLYDGLNSRGALNGRTRAGSWAVRDVRRVFALANRGLHIDTFDDGECAEQSDSVTCGLCSQWK
jgi:hypothetical protein